MDYSKAVDRLIARQLRDWNVAGRNYAALAGVSTRRLELGESAVVLQFNPEHNDTGIRIASPHIADLLQLFLGRLGRMMMRPSRFIFERAKVAVISFHPFVNRRTGYIVACRCL